MKKIIIFLLPIVLFFSGVNIGFATCKTSTTGGSAGIQSFLSNCAKTTEWKEYWVSVGDGKISGKEQEKFKEKVTSMVTRSLQFAALFSIVAMVVSGILYTTAYGSDERITKAKKTAIFAGLGLFITLISFPFVNAIVSFVYNIWSGK